MIPTILTSSVFNVTSHPTLIIKHTSAKLILVKIGTILHFYVKKSQNKIQYDTDNFDGVMTSSVFNVTSHPTLIRKQTSAKLILVKIGMILHFYVKKSQKQFQNDTDNFD